MFKQFFLIGCSALAIAAVPGYLEMQEQKRALANKDVAEAVVTEASGTDVQARPVDLKADTRPTYVTGTRSISIPVAAGGHFVGDFRINGRSIRGVVDTGATTVAMNVSTARKLGLNTQRKDFIYRLGTANGETTAAKVNLSRIEIGPISVNDVAAFVLDDSALDETLIGMSFMSRLASYKVQAGELKLEN
ncbi:TIGR02281 family clan AA aspartic protease [Pseudohoeflea suaedae]|uniref:TIGR02281 family clan AA aspartic protease n=1 Tax=Pseudohoeflea suaedae TaxID=877384 RepID=A0A4V3A797_9HYPH|nr:TIGR02281 family clan AA aspartic protease [Pseudohoeflea suaedae]TDH37915.1 TIGR02281 family clan AA aspartic protease [Pseudohoeflea suaedae]